MATCDLVVDREGRRESCGEPAVVRHTEVVDLDQFAAGATCVVSTYACAGHEAALRRDFPADEIAPVVLN